MNDNDAEWPAEIRRRQKRLQWEQPLILTPLQKMGISWLIGVASGAALFRLVQFLVS